MSTHQQVQHKNLILNVIDRLEKVVLSITIVFLEATFCEQRFCRCWSSFIAINELCYKKVNPEESGCTYDEQCAAVWPDSTCSASGICKCPVDQKVTMTREGKVCHLPNECPTNQANGVLFARNSNHPAECYFFNQHGQELPGLFMGCEEAPEIYDCIDSLCCPTRAFTCIQPVDEGETPSNQRNSTVKRFYYNSATGTCRPFRYLGSKGKLAKNKISDKFIILTFIGNANHFLTRQHCESYCKSRCSRGQPLLEETRSIGKGSEVPEALLENLMIQCTTSDDCRYDKFECSKRQVQSVCCPTIEYICSEYGGISGLNADLKKRPLQPPYNSGISRFNKEPVSRWYWDRVARKCRIFRYYGQAGNFNNFLSLDECVDFCSISLCPVGSPLRIDSGNVECKNDHQCPRTHECRSSVCCPTSAYVCNLPLILGSACHSEPTTRYYYNSKESICKPFQYNGCGSNANSFKTLDECQDFCSFTETEPTCSHGEPIRLDNNRYWKCNNNTHKEGTDFDECPIHYECDTTQSICCPSKEHTCQLPFDSGIRCGQSEVTRWYFDSTLKACKPFDFYGCDGNWNRFESEQSCANYCGVEAACPYGGQILINETTNSPFICGPSLSMKCPQNYTCLGTHCCPSRWHICSLPVKDNNDPGNEPSIRYAFDVEKRQCKPFISSSTSSCEANCFANSQENGEIVFRKRPTDDPFDCTNTSCPPGFICVVDLTNLDRNICCGNVNMGLCPEGQGVYVDSRTHKPKTCDGDHSNDCPVGYLGMFNKDRRKFYCCSPNNFKTPFEKKHADERASGLQHRSTMCTGHGPACPPTFILDVELSRTVCDPIKSPTCGDSLSVCLHSDVLERFVCCKRGLKTTQELKECPGKMIQVKDLCLPNFYCIRRNFDRVGICCGSNRTSHAIATPLQCPLNTKPYKDSIGQLKICNDQISCPKPYKCHLSETVGSRTRVCCLEVQVKVARCPHKLLPLLTEGGQFCKDPKTSCPPGYFCHDNEFCCPTPDFACSVPFHSGLKCEKGVPQQRWFFHSPTGRCQPFTYLGCSPSANNFADNISCYRLCVSSETRNARTQCSFPYSNPDNAIAAQPCTEEGEYGCKEKERCVINAHGRLVCCTLPENGMFNRLLTSESFSSELNYRSTAFCGPEFVPLLDEFDQLVSCHPFKNRCKLGNICQYISTLQNYICCVRKHEYDRSVFDYYVE
ncbi:Arginine kinase [Aphelenchoides besseyi]|nr:Arginine kinase [Aphelenchoides besseyi]